MNNRGFTLVELLTVVVILGLISSIGVISYNKVINKGYINYYNSLENSLEVAATSYYKDNRSKRPGNGEVCSYVTVDELVNNNYVDKVLDKNKSETCGNSKVYIRRESSGSYSYKTALNCDNGNYQSTFNEKEYCILDEKTNKNSSIGIIGRVNGETYIVNNTYKNTPWTDSNVVITLTSTKDITRFSLFNNQLENTYNCNSSNNMCTITITNSGSYNVTSYLNDTKIDNNQFNVRIDKDKPIYKLNSKNIYDINIDSNVYNLNESLVNINDTSGISKLFYTLTSISKNKVITANEVNNTNISINRLTNGRYKLDTIGIDYVGNKSDLVSKEFKVTRQVRILDSKNTNYEAYHKVIDNESFNYVETFTLPSNSIGLYTSKTGGTKINNVTIVDDSIKLLYIRYGE